jgi:hypothetical protein
MKLGLAGEAFFVERTNSGPSGGPRSLDRQTESLFFDDQETSSSQDLLSGSLNSNNRGVGR